MKILHVFWVILFCLFCASCQMQGQNQSWTEQMRGMAQSLNQLIPYIYNKQRFENPQNKQFIEVRLSTLNRYSHSLDHHVAQGLSGDDPLFRLGLTRLKENIQRSSESYFSEDYDYAQSLLQNTVNYCAQCHLSSKVGRQFLVYDQFNSGEWQEATPVEKAKAMVAMRQFDEAVNSLRAAVLNNSLKKSERLKSLKLMMAIEIRNLKSPDNSLAALQKAGASVADSSFKKTVAYLKKWQGQWNSLPLNQALIANKDKSLFGYLVTLHRTLILHESLPSVVDKVQRSQILLALGLNYMDYEDLGFGQLPQSYFEACFLESPKGPFAPVCKTKLEESLRKSLKLKATDPLPEAEKSRLDAL